MEDYIAAFNKNVCTCIYLEMKSETLNFALYLSVEFCVHLFLHNVGVLNVNLSKNICKTQSDLHHIFSIFCCT